MPVTLQPWADLSANYIQGRGFAHNAWDMIPKAQAEFSEPPKIPGDVLQSSYGANGLPPNVLPSTNGLVDSVVRAYAGHHHLVIRPEDIWFAILTQFSYFVNQHAEDLRHLFVAHEGKKKLRIDYEAPSRFMFDFSLFAADMGHMIQKNVVDPELREWIIPRFSTTTKNDEIVASIIMMGTLQKYFDYICGITCGLPSVTLQGEKKDYEDILARIDKLTKYGEEPAEFAAGLRPVLQRLSDSFDTPKSDDIEQFWRQILVVDDSICGITLYTGWLTAFTFWNDNGKKIRKIDGAVNSEDIAPGWTRVPVLIVDHGEEVEAEMTAGSLGIQCSGSANGTAGSTADLDSMQPLTGWWIHRKV